MRVTWKRFPMAVAP